MNIYLNFSLFLSVWLPLVSLYILLSISPSRSGTGLHGRLSQPVLLIQAACAPPQTVFPMVCLNLCCSSCGGHAAAVELFSNWWWIRRFFSRSSRYLHVTNKTYELYMYMVIMHYNAIVLPLLSLLLKGRAENRQEIVWKQSHKLDSNMCRQLEQNCITFELT